MRLNPTQRRALFEKLKQSGKLKTPSMTPTMPKEEQMPAMPQVASTKNVMNKDKVDPNYIGKVHPARFRKLKSIFGL